MTHKLGPRCFLILLSIIRPTRREKSEILFSTRDRQIEGPFVQISDHHIRYGHNDFNIPCEQTRCIIDRDNSVIRQGWRQRDVLSLKLFKSSNTMRYLHRDDQSLKYYVAISLLVLLLVTCQRLDIVIGCFVFSFCRVPFGGMGWLLLSVAMSRTRMGEGLFGFQTPRNPMWPANHKISVLINP